MTLVSIRRAAFCLLVLSLSATAMRAQELTVTDAAFFVSLSDASGASETILTNTVPLISDRAYYGWQLRLSGAGKLVKATEVFTLPAAPKLWGGVDGNQFSPTSLLPDRLVAQELRRMITGHSRT